VERLIGSIRRECLDHIVILGEDHLRRVLAAYAAYYNDVRPHLALAKDAPLSRPVQHYRLIQRGGRFRQGQQDRAVSAAIPQLTSE
jgi:Integrase core domain